MFFVEKYKFKVFVTVTLHTVCLAFLKVKEKNFSKKIILKNSFLLINLIEEHLFGIPLFRDDCRLKLTAD